MKTLVANILARWSADWRDVLASALGAGLAWVLAQRLFGHAEPIFAPISTIICLAPGLPNHTRQTMGLLLGVATGIAVGELSLLVPDAFLLLRIVSACFFAMLIASAYGHSPIVPIQAGVSAILVVAIGPATTGSVRMIDVGVGAAVGLVISLALTDRQQDSGAKPQDAAGSRRGI